MMDFSRRADRMRLARCAIVTLLAAAATIACGQSGGDENADIECPLEQTACGSSCVNLDTDGLHCGACNSECPPASSCLSGQCTCHAGLMACNGQCVNLDTDGNNRLHRRRGLHVWNLH
jgi:hypothetical protein